MDKKYYDFKASNVETAKKNGLAELGLTEEEVDIEILANGGIFSKALVRITPKVKEEPVPEEKPQPMGSYASEETEDNDGSFAELLQSKMKKPESAQPTKDVPYELLKEKQEQGKQFMKEFLSHISPKVNCEQRIRNGELYFYINGEDARSFIGYKGEILESVQLILSHYLNQLGDPDEPHVSVVVDADFYREKRKKQLMLLAKRAATEACTTHKPIAMEPMNSYERRIVHTALQYSNEATTESEGEGKKRHVVIKPKNMNANATSATPSASATSSESSFKKTGPAHSRSFGYDRKRFF